MLENAIPLTDQHYEWARRKDRRFAAHYGSSDRRLDGFLAEAAFRSWYELLILTMRVMMDEHEPYPPIHWLLGPEVRAGYRATEEDVDWWVGASREDGRWLGVEIKSFTPPRQEGHLIIPQHQAIGFADRFVLIRMLPARSMAIVEGWLPAALLSESATYRNGSVWVANPFLLHPDTFAADWENSQVWSLRTHLADLHDDLRLLSSWPYLRDSFIYVVGKDDLNDLGRPVRADWTKGWSGFVSYLCRLGKAERQCA